MRFLLKGLVNRSGGVRRQVNRGRVFHRCLKRSIFSLPLPASPPPGLDGQLGPLRAFLAKRGQGEKNTSAMLEVIHLFHCVKILEPFGYLSLYGGNFQTASSPPDFHENNPSKTRAPLSLDLLQETGPPRTSLKLLAPSDPHEVKAARRRKAVTVGVYITAGAGRRMRGGFHARDTLARFPRSAPIRRSVGRRVSV